MNKNILKYIPMLMALLMVSCSSDDTLEGDAPSLLTAPESIDDRFAISGIKDGFADFRVGEDEKPITRSGIAYDRIANVVNSWWESGDKIGVFYVGNEKTQITFVLDDEQTNLSSNPSYGIFKTIDDGVECSILANKGYVSYVPYKEQTTDKFTYKNVPVSFLGQKQASNVKMNRYLHRNDNDNGVSKNAYLESEKAAGAHLAAYDYQVSDVVSTPSGHVHFKYNSMTSVVRFFINVPAALYYDNLQIVNNTVEFMQAGTMNVLERTFTVDEKSHVLSLEFEPSIDMTNNKDYDYWNDSPTNHSGYLMAYMMMAPINLNLESVDNTTLYLCGHEVGGTKRYYKATLSKINFEGGKHYQWSPKLNPDEPITFEEVTVQTWTSAVYGNNGAGTETW